MEAGICRHAYSSATTRTTHRAFSFHGHSKRKQSVEVAGRTTWFVLLFLLFACSFSSPLFLALGFQVVALFLCYICFFLFCFHECPFRFSLFFFSFLFCLSFCSVLLFLVFARPFTSLPLFPPAAHGSQNIQQRRSTTTIISHYNNTINRLSLSFLFFFLFFLFASLFLSLFSSSLPQLAGQPSSISRP